LDSSPEAILEINTEIAERVGRTEEMSNPEAWVICDLFLIATRIGDVPVRFGA
jgi:hypothetical protein